MCFVQLCISSSSDDCTLRRQKHVGGPLDDPDFSPPPGKSIRTTTPERAKTNIKDVLYSMVRGDAELEDLLTAARSRNSKNACWRLKR